jgi:hypothetical protein
MPRLVALGVALFLFVAACALVGPPAPPEGTRPVQARVDNRRPDPVEITVRTPIGALPGAVQPTSRVEAFSTADVTMYVPLEGQWTIARNGNGMISSVDLDPKLDNGFTVHISLRPNGWGWDCGPA